MVLPQRANRRPVKLDCAQRKNPSPMAMVFPERTAPSQTMASNPLSADFGIHQVMARRCFLEKGT